MGGMGDAWRGMGGAWRWAETQNLASLRVNNQTEDAKALAGTGATMTMYLKYHPWV